MIRAHFSSDPEGRIREVTLEGHADFTDSGTDPLCAAVTGALTLAVNILTEVLGLAPDISAEHAGSFRLCLPEGQRERAKEVLYGLRLQLQDYEAQYPENIRVTVKDGKGKQSC